MCTHTLKSQTIATRQWITGSSPLNFVIFPLERRVLKKAAWTLPRRHNNLFVRNFIWYSSNACVTRLTCLGHCSRSLQMGFSETGPNSQPSSLVCFTGHNVTWMHRLNKQLPYGECFHGILFIQQSAECTPSNFGCVSPNQPGAVVFVLFCFLIFCTSSTLTFRFLLPPDSLWFSQEQWLLFIRL